MAYAGSSQAPVVTADTVYFASGDRFVYALNLQSGQVRWRTLMAASNFAAAACGNSLLVNFEGLATLDPLTDAIKKTLFSEGDEFVSSAFAGDSNRAFVSGPKATYAFACD